MSLSLQQRARYLEELSTSLFHFILPLLPTPEELALKSQVRTLLERLVRTVEPNCRLLRFGSTANGFSLRNSDMDLCVLLEGDEPRRPAAELVTLIGSLLERETNFAVKALPKAYVPIIKLSLAPSPGLPFGIACDIGFENRLALENTRLLLTYATVDPARVRTMVLFLKVWSKRRKINSPYRGTLSSYGYTLLVLFFLIHIQSPPVLPNLQRIPPTRPVAKEDMELDGHDIWFFDDTEALRKGWQSSNLQSVGELLIDFFRFYCTTFAFNNDVVSIRGGLLTKESKQWTTDSDVGGINEMARDRNRLCIEDPFETSYNVARTVTKDGLYTIRGEFMRASRILTGRPERAVSALAQLCEERDEDLVRAPRNKSPPPRNMGSSGGAPYAFGGGGQRQQMGRPVDRLSPQQHHAYLQDPSHMHNNLNPTLHNPNHANSSNLNVNQNLGLHSNGSVPPMLPANLSPNPLGPNSAPSSRSVSAAGGPRRQQWTPAQPARPAASSPFGSPQVNAHRPSQMQAPPSSQGLGLDFTIGPPVTTSTSQTNLNGGGAPGATGNGTAPFDQVVRGRGTEVRALGGGIGSGRSSPHGTPPGTPPYTRSMSRESSVVGTLSGSGIFIPDVTGDREHRGVTSLRGPSVDARGRSGGGRVGDLRLSSGGGSASGSGSSSFARRAVSTPPPTSSFGTLPPNHQQAHPPLPIGSRPSSTHPSPTLSSTTPYDSSAHVNHLPTLPPSNSYSAFGHPTPSHLSVPSSPTYLSPSLLLSPTSTNNEVPHPLISASARAVGAGARYRNEAPGRDSSTSRAGSRATSRERGNGIEPIGSRSRAASPSRDRSNGVEPIGTRSRAVSRERGALSGLGGMGGGGVEGLVEGLERAKLGLGEGSSRFN